MSNSGSKKFEFASGKMKPGYKKIEDSLKSDTSGISASASKSLGELKSNSRIGESSDAYTDDEFASYSKSNNALNKILPPV